MARLQIDGKPGSIAMHKCEAQRCYRQVGEACVTKVRILGGICIPGVHFVPRLGG